MLEKFKHPVMVHVIKEASDVRFHYEAYPLLLNCFSQLSQTLMLVTAWSIAVTATLEDFLIDLLQDLFYRQFHYLVLKTTNA